MDDTVLIAPDRVTAAGSIIALAFSADAPLRVAARQC